MQSGVVISPGGGSGPNGIDDLTMSQALKQWAVAGSYELISGFAYDSDGVLTDANVNWPDGSAGVFETVSIDPDHLVPSEFTITHVNSGLTVVQGEIVRNDDGNITSNNGITVI